MVCFKELQYREVVGNETISSKPLLFLCFINTSYVMYAYFSSIVYVDVVVCGMPCNIC